MTTLSPAEEVELQGLYNKAELTVEEQTRKAELESRVPMAEEVPEPDEVSYDNDPSLMSGSEIWRAGYWI